jgi:group II intron reverse transcriptase/maturase
MSIQGKTEMYSNRWLRIGHAAGKADTVFNSLMAHINVETLTEAYDCLDATKAIGTDGVSKKAYGAKLEENLKNLVARIHIGSYKPQVKREILIPKANGKMRPIAISCFEDKLVEWAVGKILTSMYDPTFIKNSFGFRENRSAHGAINAIYCSLKDNKRPNVVEIDFASFFNSISHKELMKILSKRINDNRFKGLIGRFLKVGIMKQSGELENPEVGTPQGSIMSPVLANIFLHEVLDQWFIKNYASNANIIVRYADDAVFFFGSEDIAKKFVEELGKRIAQYDLKLNEEKTNIISFDKSKQNTFDFLGFTFYWGKKERGGKQPLKIKTQQKALHKKIQEFDHWIKSVRSQVKLKEIWKLTKAKLVGHYNYYGYADNLPKLNHFYAETIRSLFKWLNRRSQKSSFNWEQFKRRMEFNSIPTPPPMTALKYLRREWAYV